MRALEIRPADSCRFDLVSLGEVMLRFDPGEGRTRTTRSFRVSEGGGEYNVARGLRRCFGMRTAIVTSLADNEVGRLLEDLILQGGVDTSLIKWVPYDGIGRGARNGLNFVERGFGLRAPVSVSDRGNSAASMMEPTDIDWEHLFGDLGVRWFHTGGIYAGLSANSLAVMETAIAAARRHGAVISYDLNYRSSLWKALGGPARAQEVNSTVVRSIDVIFGNEEDYTLGLGLRCQTQQQTSRPSMLTTSRRRWRISSLSIRTYALQRQRFGRPTRRRSMIGGQSRGVPINSARRPIGVDSRFSIALAVAIPSLPA